MVIDPTASSDQGAIVLATGNPHKVAELRAILAASLRRADGRSVPILGLHEAAARGQGQPLREPEEPGETFEANAAIKALAYAEQTGLWCLADDSGLAVDELEGAPGVISSHYSTGGVETGLSRADRDAANNARLLSELEGVPPERRGARFVCCMCLAEPGRVLARSRGVMEGRIGTPPRVPAGADGFGYDPLFLVGPAFAHTGAELPPHEKNRLSHRARAAEAMAGMVAALLDARDR